MKSDDVRKIVATLREWKVPVPEAIEADLVAEFDTRDFSGTVAEAQRMLTEKLADGAECPVCHQFAKLYAFSVNAAIARALIMMYRTNGMGWVDVPSLGLPGGHFAKLRFWGLIEKPDDAARADGNPRVGIWRVTEAGRAWIMEETTIPKYANIYNNHCYGVGGEPVSIRQALGKKFSYPELMESRIPA